MTESFQRTVPCQFDQMEVVLWHKNHTCNQSWKICQNCPLCYMHSGLENSIFKDLLWTSSISNKFDETFQYNFVSISNYFARFSSVQCVKETWLARSHSPLFSYFLVVNLSSCFLGFVFVISRTWSQKGSNFFSPCHSAPKVTFVE